MSLSVVIAAGGTGGHMYPGLALAEAIRESAPDARITFVGTTRGLEGKLVPSAGFPLRIVDMVPLTMRHGAVPPTRDFTFVEDTARGFLAVASSDKRSARS